MTEPVKPVIDIERLHRHAAWYEGELPEAPVQPLSPKGGPHVESPPREIYPYICYRLPLVVTTTCYRRTDNSSEDTKVFEAHSSAPEDLTLALATGANGHRKYALRDALVIASEACGRCMNALAWQYGLDWGFPPGSEKWNNTRTRCVMCAHSEGTTP